MSADLVIHRSDNPRDVRSMAVVIVPLRGVSRLFHKVDPANDVGLKVGVVLLNAGVQNADFDALAAGNFLRSGSIYYDFPLPPLLPSPGGRGREQEYRDDGVNQCRSWM